MAKNFVENYDEYLEKVLPEYCKQHCTLYKHKPVSLCLHNISTCKSKYIDGHYTNCEQCNWNDDWIAFRKKIGDWEEIDTPIVCSEQWTEKM